MAMADTRDRLAGELTGPIGQLGLDLEAVDLTNAGKRRVLRVAIDKDGGVTMDDIADATREGQTAGHAIARRWRRVRSSTSTSVLPPQPMAPPRPDV